MCAIINQTYCLYSVTATHMSMQASQASSDDLLVMKDAHIAALQTELKGKDRILHAKAKVRTGVNCSALYMCTHTMPWCSMYM